jgi:TRAP-type C4-dicarboxylate transport system substrate-binding protein
MKKLLVFLLVSILVITGCGRPKDSAKTSGEGGNKEVHTIRIAYLVSEEQSSHLAALTYKEKLEKESDGRLKVEL